MDKRVFLRSAVAGAAAAPLAAAAAPVGAGAGPTLLTVCGDGVQANRGPRDPALDQMMVKHGVQFSAAHAFDAAALQRLPVRHIRPTLEYDARPHALRGPLLTTVLEAAGVRPADGWKLALRAVDGYRVGLDVGEARAMGMIVATHLDSHPLGLGGLGPQWAVFEPEAQPAWRDRPLGERFPLCPWGLYLIDVLRA